MSKDDYLTHEANTFKSIWYTLSVSRSYALAVASGLRFL